MKTPFPAGRPRGFTLVELLVVIAIIGVLVSLLLPAVQAARESSRRTRCVNQVRQLALAAHNFHDVNDRFPPGVMQLKFNGAPQFRGVSLFVKLLPYLEQANLASNWDESDPLTNTVGGATAKTAAKLPVLLCPSDYLSRNPIDTGSDRWYGLTNYGGNGGSRSYDPQFATNDGVFFVIGSGSQTAPGGQAVRMSEVSDGLSNTILFGERSHTDRNHDSFAAAFAGGGGGGGGGGGIFINAMGTVGWWAPSGGRLAAGDVTMSAYAPINYRVPRSHGDASSMTPAASDMNSYLFYNDRRICAFGSNHPGGANFALADGSTRFLRDALGLTDLQRLCVRDDGQTVTAD
jgi:prepilin-type N-terminal cleavage/methylation domain-containing protein/prepilin-type processing-associated H-X9-DG protein